jgi:hypothetical protein
MRLKWEFLLLRALRIVAVVFLCTPGFHLMTTVGAFIQLFIDNREGVEDEEDDDKSKGGHGSKIAVRIRYIAYPRMTKIINLVTYPLSSIR